jgi:eukaryotic-like serine/threonine-protein kinase
MDLGAVAFRGTTRFRLVRFLGRGGMGVVYEAFDEVNAVPVALKLLPVVNPDMLLRFKREFRAVADVRHPNLVRLGELVSEGSQWFFSMELVQGTDLMSYVRGVESARSSSVIPILASDAPTPIVLPGEGVRRPEAPVGMPYRAERLRPVLGQLAQALAALHAAQCVHRDVKPSNVLVTDEGRTVLLDFGLVSAASIETTQSGAGTPEYMAPEQVAHLPVSAAADWYAFGVILFELLTGRLPFEGLPHEILYRKQHGRPPQVTDLVPDAPADLAALCDGLLDAHPDSRLGGAEVLARLMPPAPGAAAPVVPLDEPVRFVGRKNELGLIEAALGAVRTGESALALIIRGESGVGKSSLVRAFLEAHQPSGEADGASGRDESGEEVVLLTARCYERELVPFKALDGLVDVLTHVLRKMDQEVLEAIIPQRAAVLLQAFPVLGRVPVIAHAPQELVGPDPREVRASMFAVFRQLLRALGERAPVIAFVDDLQWADADSLALLSEVLRPPNAPRLLLLGTLRTPTADAAVAHLLAAGVPEQHLPLSNLEDAAARALARGLLVSGGSTDPDGGADLIARESAGHPLFLLELARTAHLRRDDAAPLTLDGVLRAQMEASSAPAVRILRTLAVAGAPTPVRLLRRLTALDGATAIRLFDELRAAKLVNSVSDRGDELLDFSHDRIRQVARLSTSTADARELHEQLAEAFEDAGNSLRAGGHWREAGHPDRAAIHFSSAARRAAEALAFDRAAAHYKDALALGNWSEEQRRELLIGLGDALSNVGRGAEAAPHYLSAARNAGPAHALDLRRRGAEELIRSGRLDEGRAVATEALADAGLKFASSPVRALLAQRAKLRLRGRRFRSRTAEEIAPRELARVDLCWSISSGLGLMDPVQGAHFQVRSLLLALAAGEPYRVARGIAGEAAYAAAQGDGARSRRLLAEAGAIAAKLDYPNATGIVSLMSGLSAHLGGHFAPALDHLLAAERTFRDKCVGAAWELNAVRHFTLECFYYLGELERFRASAVEGLKEANDRGSVYASTTLRIGLANAVSLIGDEPDRARNEARAAMQAWSAGGYHIQHWYELIAHTQIDLYGGDGEAAYTRFRAGWPALRRSLLLRLQHTRTVAIHLRGRTALAGALVAAGAERAERLRLARQCALRLRREGGWASAMAALLYAGVERLEGNGAEGAAWLRRAIEETGAHGLALFRAAAQVAAGESGGDDDAGDEGEGWMRRNGVRAPSALTRMLVPAAGRAPA